jgi:hypothetical protein
MTLDQKIDLILICRITSLFVSVGTLILLLVNL